MDLENPPLPYLEWLLGSFEEPGAIVYWLATVIALALGALVITFLFTAARQGPGRAGDVIFKVLSGALADIVRISPRRVFALAGLSIREAVRRRVVVAFLVFVVVLLFAGWFLSPGTPDPAKLYLSFVLTAITYLVLALAVLLSAFSLPNDIQNRTIFTVVTKPVRPSEIVIGRTLGFTAIGTVLLALMGLGGYFFIIRTLDHRHVVTAADLQELPRSADGASPAGKQGNTSTQHEHRHHITVDAAGNGVAQAELGHSHRVTADEDGFQLGPPQGQFRSRMPVYGNLRFKNRDGNDAVAGINVGNERTYRSYVEGGTPAAAIWKFSDIDPDDYPKGLPLEMTIRVFRTYKGRIDRGILGSITLVNPRKPRVASIFRTFLAKEYSIDRHLIPLEFQDDTGRTVNLFDDLVEDGELEVHLKCLERAQFFGMAEPDVYLLPTERSFEVNFAKSCASIWLQMALITTLGVAWSTFLNGPVALLATMASLVGGFFVEFIQDLATNKVLGGGTFEAMIRIVRQDNLMTQLDPGIANTAATWLDHAFRVPLFVVSRALPNFPSLSSVDYVAHGFDIPINLLGAHLTTVLGFALPVLVVGMLCFKVREVAK